MKFEALILIAKYESLLAEKSLGVKYGAELEFYLSAKLDNFIGIFQEKHCNIDIAAEKGPNQYELQLPPSTQALKLIELIKTNKNILQDFLAEHNINAIFASKPFEKAPGSALHIHFNLYDLKSGRNLYQKSPNQEEERLTLWSIGGLCFSMPYMMKIFSPQKSDYKRFEAGYDAPMNISWGGNNRTTAIRLPVNGANRRIEHRVAAANSEPAAVIAAILLGVIAGIENQIMPPARVFGNAYDDQYNLPSLPGSFIESQQLWAQLPKILTDLLNT